MNRDSSNSQYPEHFYRPGMMVYWKHQYLFIEECNVKEMTIRVSNYSTGEHQTIQVIDLVNSTGEDEPIYGKDVNDIQLKIKNHQARGKDKNLISEGGIPEKHLNKAKDVKRVVEFVLRAIEVEKIEKKNKKICEVDIIKNCLENLIPQIKLTTFYDWKQRYLSHNGDILRIAQSFQTARYGKTQHSPVQVHMVNLLLDRYHFSPKTVKFRLSFVRRRIQLILKRSGGLWIDLAKCTDVSPDEINTLIELLLDINSPFPDLSQHPSKLSLLSKVDAPKKSWLYAHHKHLQEVYELEDEFTRTGFTRFGQRVQTPLDLGVLDEMEMTIYQVVKGAKKELLDIWVTFIIDAYTRVIPGFQVHVGTPDLGVGLATLQNCIFPKDLTEFMGFPILMPYGIFKTLSWDNAMSHDSDCYMIVSDAVSCGGEYRKFEICFRPPRQPVKGALVERFNGTFSERFKEKMAEIAITVSELLTSSIDKQAEYIEEYITRELINIINEYHNTRHTSLRQPPIDCWNEALEQLIGLPKVPPLTNELERIFWPKVYGERFAKHNKISLFGLHFVREFGEPLPTFNDNGVKIPYSFHCSSLDIGRIALIRNGKWLGDMLAIELIGPDGKLLRPVSKLQRKIAQELASQAGESSHQWINFLGPNAPSSPSNHASLPSMSSVAKPSGNNSSSDNNTPSPLHYWDGRSSLLTNFAARPEND